MDIGSKMKELREAQGLTRKEAVEKLKALGIDISDKTLYGYESGRNSANADMFLALCKIYNCNNIMETFSSTVEKVLFTNNEWQIIEQYRLLDNQGKEAVDYILKHETKRTSTIAQKDSRIAELEQSNITQFPNRSYLEPVAAHKRTDIEVTEELQKADDDIMDNDDEWK